MASSKVPNIIRVSINRETLVGYCDTVCQPCWNAEWLFAAPIGDLLTDVWTILMLNLCIYDSSSVSNFNEGRISFKS